MTDYRDESTFSFDPSRIPVKQLGKDNKTKKKVDGRKGVLLSSVTRKRKKSRRRRTPSQQRLQSDHQQPEQQHQYAPDDEGTDEGAPAAETDAGPEDATVDASMVPAGATTSADDFEDSGGSRFSTPRRKPPLSSHDQPKAPSPHPATPPPQPEPPPVAVDATSVAAKSAADTLRPCALVAPQG